MFGRKKKQDQVVTEHKEEQPTSGVFQGFVCLSDADVDMSAIKDLLQEDWGFTIDHCARQDTEEPLVFEVDGMLGAMSLLPMAIPDGEAEYHAQNNYFWKEGAEVISKHQAHILIAVLPQGNDPRKAGTLFVKIADTVLKQPKALGIYTSGTVFQPELYHDFTEMLKEGMLPINNLVYFGLCQEDQGISAYTNGLTSFGHREIEILNTSMEALDLQEFLFDIASYVLDGNVTLRPGETIGMSEDQKLPILLSEGKFVEGESLKIVFPA